jgi:MarR family transcriptional regulator, lower aerobic nicotinate degradation pathway regulator
VGAGEFIKYPYEVSTPMKTLAALYRRPGFLMRRAHQIASGVFEDECGTLGLTQAQHGVLVVAAQRPHADQSALAQALGFDRATTGEIQRGLERRGLIRRTASPRDARKRSIELTSAGRDMLERAAPALERAQQRLLGVLSASERKQLIGLLGQFCDAFNAEARAPLAKIRR